MANNKCCDGMAPSKPAQQLKIQLKVFIKIKCNTESLSVESGHAPVHNPQILRSRLLCPPLATCRTLNPIPDFPAPDSGFPTLPIRDPAAAFSDSVFCIAAKLIWGFSLAVVEQFPQLLL